MLEREDIYLRFQTLFDDFVKYPDAPYEPLPVTVKVVSDEFVDTVLTPALKDESKAANNLYRVSQSPDYSSLEKSQALYLAALCSTENLVLFRSLLKSSGLVLLETDEQDDCFKRKRFKNLAEQIPFLVGEEHLFAEAFRIQKEILAAGYIDYASSLETSILFINSLECLPYVADSEDNNTLIAQVLDSIESHLDSIPLPFRPWIFTKLLKIFDSANIEQIQKLKISNQLIKSKFDGPPEKFENLEENEMELDMMLVKAHVGKDSKTYQKLEAAFMNDHKEKKNYVEDLSLILLEKGLYDKDEALIHKVLDIQKYLDYDFHLAETQVRVLCEYPNFYKTETEKVTALLESWRPIEQSLGVDLVEEMIRAIEDCAQISESYAEKIEKISSVEGIAMNQVEADIGLRAEAYFDSRQSLPPLAKNLAKAVLTCFSPPRAEDMREYLVQSVKKGALAVYQFEAESVQGMYEFASKFTDEKGVLRTNFTAEDYVDLGIDSMRLVDPDDCGACASWVMKAHQTGHLQTEEYVLKNEGNELSALRQEMAVPLEDGRVVYMEIKLGKPISLRSCRFIHSALSGGNISVLDKPLVKEFLRPKKTRLEIMSIEQMQKTRYRGTTLWKYLNGIYFKESKIGFIEADVLVFGVLFDDLTGEPLAFMSLKKVDENNYGCILENFPEDKEGCEAEIRRNTGIDIDLSKVVEVGNMGVVHRLFNREIMAKHYHGVTTWYRESKLFEAYNKQYAVMTLQTPLQKIFTDKLGVTLILAGEGEFDVEAALESMDRRGSARGFDVQSEAPYIRRGSPRLLLMDLSSLLNSTKINKML